MGHWQRNRARRAAAIPGIMLAAVLAAGCAHAPAVRPPPALAACTNFATRAIEHRVVITSLPAACQGLTKEQVNAAALDALAATASSAHGPRRGRAHIQDVRLLLTHPLVRYPVQPVLPPVSASPAGQAGGLPLAVVTLVTWLITVSLGGLMMARWALRGGLRRARGHGGRFSPAMNFAHLGLAVAGLADWVIYLVTGLAGLAWAGCAFLFPVAGLGMTLVAQWFTDSAPASEQPPAGRPPVLLVAAHIGFAVTTILLAVLVAV